MVSTHKGIYIVLIEHLGDIVACEPVSRRIRRLYPDARLTWVTKKAYADVVRFNPHIDEVKTINSIYEWSQLKASLDSEIIIIDLHFSMRYCSESGYYVFNDNEPAITDDNYYLHGSLLESFTLSARLDKLTDAPQFHFAPDEQIIEMPDLPEKYVTIHCQSAEDARDWEQNKWIELVRQLNTREMTVVELGLKPTLNLVGPHYRDCTDIHAIQTVAKIIQQSDHFIGIDSALAHIANACEIPSVILLGQYRNFKTYLPYTGYLSRHKDEMIIQHHAPAKEIAVEQVINMLDSHGL